MPRGLRSIVLLAFGCLALGNAIPHQRGRGLSLPPDALDPATAPQASDAALTVEPTRACYPESDLGVSCDGIEARAAVDLAREVDEQVTAAWWQLAVGTATLVAALFAVLFAERAAHYSRRSAREAESSTPIVDEGQGISATSNRRQLRAYIVPEEGRGVSVDNSDDRFAVNLVYKNIGNTPAVEVRSFLRVVAVESLDLGADLPILPLPEAGPNVNIGVMGVNEKNDVIEYLQPSEGYRGIMNNVSSGSISIIAYGYIVYKDIFGMWCHCVFRYHLSAGSDREEGVFSLARITFDDDVKLS